MKTRIISVLLAFIFTVILTSCSTDNEVIDSYPDMKTLSAEIYENCIFPEMFEPEDADIKGEYGVDASLFDDFYAASPLEYPGIERMFFGVVSDRSNIQEIVSDLGNTLETVKAEYIEYIPTEYDKAKDSEIIVKDRFVSLIITADYDKAVEIINNNIK